MKFTDLTVLLPCHSLEDFPTYHEGSSADQLLAAWCALWHPGLIAAANSTPDWHRVDIPPENLAGRLITVPEFCADRLAAGFAARAQNERGWLVRARARDQATAAALEGLDEEANTGEALAADFRALGFCRLQVELLTRQMRYSMHVDETHFRAQTLAAASAAVAGDEATAREHLQQCFDTLYEARKHFYPVDAYLLDITLLAATTLGASLAHELDDPTPKNLLVEADLLKSLSAEHSDIWARVLSAIDAGRLCVLGNERQETELPLLPLEAVLDRLSDGARQYEKCLGRRPRVFARRRFGLWPTLPQLLVKLGYHGAMHFTLDDGQFPLGPQCKTRWQGLDGNAIDIYARVPCDAARPETFLGYSRKMSDSMDSDHVATLSLVHWPGTTSPWYEDFRRVAAWSPVLGKFALADDYFSNTDMPGRISQFAADEYRTPYLKQSIIRGEKDSISKCVEAHRRQSDRAARQAIVTMRELASGRACPQCAEWSSADVGLVGAMEKFAAALPRSSGLESTRCLFVNPLAFSRKIGVELPGWTNPPETRPPVVAAGMADGRALAVVEVPAMGFAVVEPADSPPTRSKAKSIAKDNVLSNEFFDVTLSRSSGGIASIVSRQRRGNQLSQQLAFRVGQPVPGAGGAVTSDDVLYATAKAESLEVTISTPAMAEVVAQGALVDVAGKRWAGFRQVTRVWAGSPIIELDVELTDVEEPRADPWNSYYAARFAWPDEMAQLWRGVGLSRQQTDATRFESPEFVEIDEGSSTTAILTGGLPYHRRTGPRMLDSLLVVRGETSRRFSLAIGVNLPRAGAGLMEWLSPTTMLSGALAPFANRSGWFFHLDTRNIVATHWRPLVDDEASSSVEPRSVRGFRARLLETLGQGGRATLRAFRKVAAARQVDFSGQPMLELKVEDDKITLDFGEREWIEIEAVWA